MLGPIAKCPVAFIANGIDDGHSDRLFKALQLSKNNRPMSPGAGKRNVKMISISLGKIWRRTVALHPIAKRIFLALE